MRNLSAIEIEEVAGGITASDVGYWIGYAIGTTINYFTALGDDLGGVSFD